MPYDARSDDYELKTVEAEPAFNPSYDADPGAIGERIAKLKEIDHTLRVHAKQEADMRVQRAKLVDLISRDMDAVKQMVGAAP